MQDTLSEGKKQNKGIFFVLLIFIIAVIILALILFKPEEVKPTKPEIKPETSIPEKVKLNEEGIPFGPLTTIYFNEKVMTFADNDANIHDIWFWDSINLIEESRFLIDDRLYTVATVDRENNNFTIVGETTPNIEEETINIRFELGKPKKIALKSIYGTPLEYYLAVFKVIDKESGEEYLRMQLMLAEKEFNLQFGKKLFFAGTDINNDGKIEKEFYQLNRTDYGFNAEKDKLAAHFYIDEDNDGSYDIKYYSNTLNDTPIKIEFTSLNGPQELNESNENMTVYSAFGTQIEKLMNKVTIRIPKD